MILIIVDTTGIQPYIFGSNRLQENIGGSFLVKRATNDWAREVAGQAGGREVYAGGGNYLVTFDNGSQAKEFVRSLSRQGLIKAPGLQLVMAQQECGSEVELPAAVRAGFIQLAQQKRCRPLSAPLLGLGVTRMCQSTGLPAIKEILETPEDDTTLYPASAEIIAKTGRVEAANHALTQGVGEILQGTYEFPRDFDNLGRSLGDHSFIAVVHADGNGLGERIQKMGERCEQEHTDYRAKIQEFSEAVETAGRNALQDTLSVLIKRLQHDGGHHIHLMARKTGQVLTSVELKELDRSRGRYYLPFRPLVFGGDDVTFVCDGRLGLSLATTFLQSFEGHGTMMPDGGEPLTACAGVAIVPVHYPFARAYQLAEQLCQSAKDYRKQNSLAGSCLDWHFAMSGVSGPLATIRRREYMISTRQRDNTVMTRTLHQRPVTLKENPQDTLHSWPAVRKGVMEFQQEWADKRNKLKALREELRSGPTAVQRFLAQTGIGLLPEKIYAGASDLPTTGWSGNNCAYFDAVELADWFIALEDLGEDRRPEYLDHEGLDQESLDQEDRQPAGGSIAHVTTTS